MKYRKIAAALAALTMMTSAFSCGKDSASSSPAATPAGVSGTASASEASSGAAQGSSQNSTEKSSASATEKSTQASSQAASTAGVNSSGQKTTAASGNNTPAANNGGGNSSGGQTAQQATESGASGGSSGGSSSDSGSGSNSGGNSSGGTSGGSQAQQPATASGGGNSSTSGSSDNKNGSGTQKTTTPANTPSGGGSQNSTEPAEEEEKTFAAEITLGSKPTISGENAVADGSTVKITAGGDYLFTGKTSNGQIYVNTDSEEKVTIVLSGVDITCNYGPAIFIDNAKKCTVKVKKDTVNNLADTTKDKSVDGVIFSNDTLRIKGNGTLNITSGNAHGIASDDDVIFDNSICNIKAVKSGISANDDITINGGTLNITAGTNGLKSKKTININGGTSYISGGQKEEKSSVYAGEAFSYTDGLLIAAGNQVTALKSSAKPYVITDLSGTVSGGTAVKLTLNGKEAGSFTPTNDFRCVLLLSPELAAGSKFGINAGSSHKGEFTVEKGKNLFSL